MITKTKFIIAGISSVLLVGCVPEASDSNLDEMISERDSLKIVLADLNVQIALLDTAKAENTLVVTAENVQIKDFVHKIEVQGAVETDKNALINAEASGTIRQVHVKEGQKVSQGQALVTIDAAILSSQIQEIETQLELAVFMFEKQKKLMEEGVGTEIEFEQARANKNRLESSIKTMNSQQGKTVVRAPFSGTIDEVMVSLGEMAAPGVPLMRLVDNKDVKITASISENLLGKIKVGTPVDLNFPSLNDTIIQSTISSRGNFIDPTNRTFRIRIDVKKNTLLLPNLLAKVNLTDFSRKDALVINAESILQDTQNQFYVYKIVETEAGTGVEKVFVNVVKKYKSEACVEPVNAGALTGNDSVVVKGAKGITESDLVTIQ